MERMFQANISAFMRGAAKNPEGWHKDINWGDYAFVLALREQYFPVVAPDIFKVKLNFEAGQEHKNQDPNLIYLKDIEFPAEAQIRQTSFREGEPSITLYHHLYQCLDALKLSLVACQKEDLPKDSDALEFRRIVSVEEVGNGKLKLGNGELAKITNKVLEGHVDHMSNEIRSRYNGNSKPSTKHLRPRDIYRGFLDHLLKGAGIENSAAVAHEAVNKIGTGCGNWERALTRATKHAKEIIPQTKMYKTTMFEIDGQKLEVHEKMPERDWVGLVTNISSKLGLSFQSEGAQPAK